MGKGTVVTSDGGMAPVRQWVSMPGGSCDVRLGSGVLETSGAVLKGAVGRPRAAVLVAGEEVAPSACETMRRQLTDAGFTVVRAMVPTGARARTLEAFGALAATLAEERLTADDLMVAVGDADVLSLASHVCAQWCGGMTLTMVPVGPLGLVEAALSPRGLAVGARDAMLMTRPSVKHVLFDTDLALTGPVDEEAMMARVLMVVTAMCDSEAAFSRLWDRTEDICAGDVEAQVEQLRDTVKTRGKIYSSTALALRQSLVYGEAFARALAQLVEGVAPSTARAEALRFQARLAAGEGLFEVDDVFAQDELLERLELPLVQAEVDPQALIEAVRQDRFARSNRFLLGLPRKLGRVRLAAVSDERIAEHVAAWCASRA